MKGRIAHIPFADCFISGPEIRLIPFGNSSMSDSLFNSGNIINASLILIVIALCFGKLIYKQDLMPLLLWS